jgi:hypothetical protein
MTVAPVNNTYTSGTLSFTTGTNSTSATIALVNVPQGSDYVYFADDLFLAEPINSPWRGQDVGTVVLAGAAGRRGSQFAIQGSGADIWGATDAFYFVYQPWTGDGQITARIRTSQNTNPSAKCGVMMRETLDPGARHVLVDWMPQDTVESLWRTAVGGSTTAAWNTGVALAPWVRLQRIGNVFTGWFSLDGVNWTQTTQQTIPMANTIYLGLAVCSHDTTQVNESILDNVTVSPSLAAALSGNRVALSWPVGATGFTLESTPALGPGASWSPVHAVVSTNNGSDMVTVPATNPAAFFRLRQ